MMKFLCLAFLLVAMPITSCATESDKPIAVDEGFALSAKDIDIKKVDAAKGNAEAAFRLSLHYSSGINASAEEARFWRLVAAENGHAVAQYSIWFMDHESQDAFLKERAIFWLRKSAASGFEDAKKQLSK
jgi:TPR repeat protein